MQVDDLSAIDPNVDYRKILPIQQKRTLAFINHFVMNTVSFLNCFAQSCESRFMEFEYKIQKVEASLLILESQLSSIPGLANRSIENNNTKVEIQDVELPEIISQNPINNIEQDIAGSKQREEPEKVEGVKAAQDPRFKKFFNMLQFGVPQQAVKLKMQMEGVDSNILDNPNAVIPGLSMEDINSSNNNNNDDSSE